MSKVNVLVTGGSGFIGTVLIRHLLSSDRIGEIVNIDLNESPVRDVRLRTVQADIRESAFENLPLGGSFDLCIHLAALCKEPGYEWEEYFDTNDVGTLNVVKLCEKFNINRVIFTSTMMVYQAGEVRRTEESLTTPDTAYGISKLLAEKELLTWEARQAQRELKIIRPAVVFGENENANFTRLHGSIKRGFFPFVGRSSTIKANIYVKELVLFIDFLAHSRTREKIFNLAFPTEYPMSRIVSDFKKVFGYRSVHPVLPMRPLMWISYLFEMLNQMGLKNSVHHRRIEKLYHSTDVYPASALKEGYNFRYDLRSALADWKASGDPNL